jgi:hypothetical protein
VGVSPLRDASAILTVRLRQGVTVDDRHPVETLDQNRRSRESRQARAQHDRVVCRIGHH